MFFEQAKQGGVLVLWIKILKKKSKIIWRIKKLVPILAPASVFN
jgi:hypothetical protein